MELEREKGVNPFDMKRNILQDFYSTDSFSSIIPMGAVNYVDSPTNQTIIVMVSVSDSLGAILNVSDSI
jgi:hypothetical protein